MKIINLGKSDLKVPAIILGCMRISQMAEKEVAALVDAALERGVNFFDHADIYGGGMSEQVFGNTVITSPAKREQLIIQSKCGIKQGEYDFSKEHILSSVDGILKRLNTDYLDILLLHRPDTLVEPEEVAAAFDSLYHCGKVRHFGMSNQNPYQLALLGAYINQPLLVNQVQFGVAHTGIIDAGINVNMQNDAATMRDGGILEYCRLHNITLQAWSPLQYGCFEGVVLDNDKFVQLNRVLEHIANEQSTDKSAVAIAWIMRHPANMQTILGTTNVDRLIKMLDAQNVQLTRQQWYEIYRSTGNKLP